MTEKKKHETPDYFPTRSGTDAAPKRALRETDPAPPPCTCSVGITAPAALHAVGCPAKAEVS